MYKYNIYIYIYIYMHIVHGIVLKKQKILLSKCFLQLHIYIYNSALRSSPFLTQVKSFLHSVRHKNLFYNSTIKFS